MLLFNLQALNQQKIMQPFSPFYNNYTPDRQMALNTSFNVHLLSMNQFYREKKGQISREQLNKGKNYFRLRTTSLTA